MTDTSALQARRTIVLYAKIRQQTASSDLGGVNNRRKQSCPSASWLCKDAALHRTLLLCN